MKQWNLHFALRSGWKDLENLCTKTDRMMSTVMDNTFSAGHFSLQRNIWLISKGWRDTGPRGPLMESDLGVALRDSQWDRNSGGASVSHILNYCLCEHTHTVCPREHGNRPGKVKDKWGLLSCCWSLPRHGSMRPTNHDRSHWPSFLSSMCTSQYWYGNEIQQSVFINWNLEESTSSQDCIQFTSSYLCLHNFFIES